MMFGSIASVKPTEGISGYAGTKTGLKGFIDSARYELRDTFPEVSIHGIYPTTVHHVGIDSVLNAVLYLMKIKFGVHADIVLSLV
jgi:short-subunit dehydrogenase